MCYLFLPRFPAPLFFEIDFASLAGSAECNFVHAAHAVIQGSSILMRIGFTVARGAGVLRIARQAVGPAIV
jgi:hypothetical protein